MLILNQTFLQPSIVRPRPVKRSPQSDHTCRNPIVSQDTFFATQSFSVAPRPTDNLNGFAVPLAYTVFADVSKQMPGELPIDPQATTPHERLAVGLGVTAGIIGLVGIFATVLWLRKQRRRKAEVSDFRTQGCEEKTPPGRG